MASSEVNICNLALLGLGKERINKLSDSGLRATTCNEFYASTRDALIRAFEWDFAKERRTMAPLVETPDWGYAFQYDLPSQPLTLRVLEVNGSEIGWVVEGTRLLTDESTIQILYLKQVTDPTKFDALFYQLLAKRLQAEVAYTLTRSTTKQDRAIALYEAVENEAFNIGSHESSLSDKDETNVLIDAR
jgi:hypothetical protein